MFENVSAKETMYEYLNKVNLNVEAAVFLKFIKKETKNFDKFALIVDQEIETSELDEYAGLIRGVRDQMKNSLSKQGARMNT